MLLGCRSQQGIPDFAYAAVTLFGRPFTGSFRYPFVFSPCRRVCRPLQNGPTTPNGQRRQAWHPSGLGSSRFARRYLGNRNCFLFLRVLRWFTSPGWLRRTMNSLYVIQDYPGWVAPFGNPRVGACLRLSEAYRSLPRPSSPSCAKASTVRP